MPQKSAPAAAPARYTDPQSEYRAARTGAALRDVSHATRLRFAGTDHLDFLHRMSTQHFKALKSGQGVQAVFTENRGRILDWGTFYHRDGQTLAALSPGSRQIPAWLDRYLFAERVEIADLSQETAMLEVFGPQASALVEKVLGADLERQPEHHLLDARDGLWLARLDLAGRPGLRAAGPAEQIEELWDALRRAGATPLGEQAWEILRVEQGLPALGRELSEEHNPWEAGLGRAIHMNKGCYIGQEVIARLDTYDKIKQHLVGLELSGEEVPAPGTALKAAESPAGALTSAVRSPLLGPIALAYVRRAHAHPGTRLQVEGGAEAGVVALPFAHEPEA